MINKNKVSSFFRSQKRLVFLFILFFSLTFMFVLINKDKDTKWKTLNSDYAKISLEYPAEWYVYEGEYPHDWYITENPWDSDIYGIHLSSHPSSTVLFGDANSFTITIDEFKGSIDEYIVSKGKIVIDSQPFDQNELLNAFIYILGENDTEGSLDSVIFKNEDKIYMIDPVVLMPDNDEYSNKIYNSIKYIN